MKIIIIGAGPVGCYTAAILGKAGMKVLVFEKDKKEDVKKNLGYIHFDDKDYEPLGVPRPSKDSPCYMDTFEILWQVPFNATKKFPIHYKTDMLVMNLFVQSLANKALETKNVEINYESPFESIISEEDRVLGVNIGNGKGEFRANLVIDCSGMKSIVRNSLPSEIGLPKLFTREGRTFTLHMERWKCRSEFPTGSNTFVSFKGFMNQVKSDETLVGISTLKGWDFTRELHKEMIQKQELKDIEHSVEEIYNGEVPYDFPPASFVANGFISIGDSAFQNKPFNGEGMASGMMAAQLALPVILNAIETNNFSIQNLWQYNIEFYKGFGADFAMIRGTGETLVELSPEEFDWMFENGFMDEKMLNSTWNTFKAKTSGKTILAAFRGFKRWTLFKRIIKGILLGVKLQKHYKKYPKSPEGLEYWNKKFNAILRCK